jgi:hypothetical protein
MTRCVTNIELLELAFDIDITPVAYRLDDIGWTIIADQ